jgi:hypothetical protein
MVTSPSLALIRDPVDQRDCGHGTYGPLIRPAEPISRSQYETEQLLIAAVALALLHCRLRRDQGAVTPPTQAGDGDVQLAGSRRCVA